MSAKVVTPSVPKQVLDYLSSSFKKGKDIKKVNPTIPHRIKFCGEFIEVGSGKTLWRTKGHAKLALNHHVNDLLFYGSDFGKMAAELYHKEKINAKFLISELESAGLIEYVPHVQEEVIITKSK
jgi:hypothetical protein